MNYEASAVLTAYALDLIIGDPQLGWHPVRILGRLTERLEKGLNTDKINKLFAGLVLVIVVVGVTILFAWLILKLGWIARVLLIYFALSIKSLGVEANKVLTALKNKRIDEARQNLSMLVGRDTEKLEETEIIRSAVETVAESTMDGIVAPLFYCFLGGPVLVWAYKAINTLDSMVGYRSERFREFGLVSAKIDGLANFIPAKLTAYLIGISSIFCGKDWLRSLKLSGRYFFRGPEKNSEATEAAMAGALRVQLGGVNYYNSIPIQKTLIGDRLHPLEIKQIKESIKIAYILSVLFICIGIFVKLIGRG